MVLELHNRQKYKKIHQTRSFVLVEDDQCADDPWHPSCAGEDEDDEHGPAAPVDDGEGREDDGEDDAEEGHGGFGFLNRQKYKIMLFQTASILGPAFRQG